MLFLLLPLEGSLWAEVRGGGPVFQEGVSALEWRKMTAQLAQWPLLGGWGARAAGPRPLGQGHSVSLSPRLGEGPSGPLAKTQAFP